MATIIPLTDARLPDAAEQRARHDAFVRAAASEATAAPGPLVDARGRPLHDLRISVTDRCNFRCVYCMPKDVFDSDYRFLPHGDLLTFEEIARVAKLFVDRGVAKIRLTGGEPLLRRNVERLVEMLARLGDIDLTLTTNGALLAKKAAGLRDAGLTRVTVSLDSLDDATFRAMNDVDFPVAKVLDGIDAAAAAGLAPLKVNMVVKRGMNERSILPMARQEEVEAAIAAAQRAAPLMAEMPAHRRSAILGGAAALILERKEDLARTIAAEAGKALKFARIEVERAASTFTIASEEARRLREYLLKGGFLFVSDYWGDWAKEQFDEQIGLALPPNQFPIVDLPLNHPIWHTLFDLKNIPQMPSIQSWRRTGGNTDRGVMAPPSAHGIADSDGHLMVVMLHNTDIPDGWEREGEDPEYFYRFSPDSYAVGINIVLYAMTH